MNAPNQTNSNSLFVEQNSVFSQKTNNFESSNRNSNNKLDPQPSLLPRSGWQDRQAFLKTLIKTKRALELAEITAFLG
jgi:hypothetical protein